MRATKVVSVTLILLFGAVLWSQAATRRSHKATKPAHTQHAWFWTQNEGKWMNVPVFPKGAQFKVMYGDPSKGPADLYVKVPAGYDTTWHWHTPVELVYVDTGQIELSMPGTRETKKLGTGGFFRSPAKMIHRARCVSQEECSFYLHSNGKFDIHLVDEHGRPRAH